MRVMFARPMGDVSRRLHGVIRQLQTRAASARDSAREAEASGQIEFAASLRGKARGYSEAVDLLLILDHGRPLRRRSQWSRPRSEAQKDLTVEPSRLKREAWPVRGDAVAVESATKGDPA
jgi:hypothetical protein